MYEKRVHKNLHLETSKDLGICIGRTASFLDSDQCGVILALLLMNVTLIWKHDMCLYALNSLGCFERF